MLNSSNRRVNPSREMVGSDLYTVAQYYPEFQTCDLYPASINQRGQLTQVPIRSPFAGSWEAKAGHQPQVASLSDPNQFGNAPRGPRWGMNLPIEPGDMAVVEYLGESMSDPVISGFLCWRGSYAVPWMANQVLSQQNDYTEQTPEDDDLVQGRFDLLLPSGAWLRSTHAGSWVMATSPVDRAKAFVALHSDGKIKIKSRAGEHYAVHLEFDPETESGRIVLGKLEDGSFIEFKDGNVTIRAKKQIRLMGEEIRGDARAAGTGTAMDALTSSASTSISDAALPGLVTAAAGQMALQGMGGGALASPGGNVVLLPDFGGGIIGGLISNPAIDGALRGRIGDVLQNPQGLLDSALEGLRGSLPNDLAIGDRLGGLLGANLLNGGLGQITSRLDLTSLPMIKELGIPSWVGTGIQAAIQGGTPVGIGLTLLSEMNDGQLLNQICSHVGGLALNGRNAIDARAALDGAIDALDLPDGLKERIESVLERLDQIPLATPRSDGEIDWTSTAAQRLGRHVLRGNNMLGGGANLFDLSQLEELGLGGDRLSEIGRVVRQIEEFAANPHTLIENLPQNLAAFMPQISTIPTEIRAALGRVPQDLLGRLPNLASGLLGNLEGQFFDMDVPPEDNPCEAFFSPVEEQINSSLPDWLPEERELGSLIQSAPQEIKSFIQDLPEDLLRGLSELAPEQFRAVLENPQSFVEGLDTGMIRNLFGGLSSASAGVFNMQVMRRAVFAPMPQGAEPLSSVGRTEFHLDTQRTEIERSAGYAEFTMPQWWDE
jgi:hypothetical protein